jgi:hypothetical protein
MLAAPGSRAYVLNSGRHAIRVITNARRTPMPALKLPTMPAARLLMLVIVTSITFLLYLSIEFPAQAQVAPSTAELKLALTRCGLDANSLTAAGLSSEDVSALVGDARQYMTEHPGALTAVDDTFASARQAAEALQHKIQSGQATEQEITSFPAAQSALTSATAARQGAVDAIFNAGTADLSEAEKDTLNRIRANKAQWELPLEYLASERSEPQWVALRDALANERIAIRRDEDPDPAAATLLAQVRAEPAVANASANLTANLTAITTAWNVAANSVQ